jgi:hypothetical protein
MRYESLLEKIIDHQGYDLDAKFAHFNRLCFGGALPKVPVKFAVLKGSAGVAKCKFRQPGATKSMSRAQRRALPAFLADGSLSIVLDRTYLRTEEEIDAILVHEMIHVWFYIQNDFTENHGLAFLRKLRECEAKTGFKIPVTEKMADREVAPNVPDQTLIVVTHVRPNREVLYAILNKTAFDKAEAQIRYDWVMRGGDKDRFIAYEVTSPLWTAHSFRVPVQRPTSIWGKWVGRARRGAMKFYYLRKPELLDDLLENGKLRFSLKNDPLV